MKYETGTRKQVIEELVESAIRDHEALIDAHLDWNDKPISDDAQEVIESCKAYIRDFRKLKKSLCR